MTEYKNNLLKLLWGLGTTVLCAFAQPQFGVNVAWLPVTEAEKAMKEPVVEKDAGVEALFWRVHVRDEVMGGRDLQRVLYHYVRLKVFNEKGKDAATAIEIPASNRATVSEIAGRTVLPDGSALELKGSDIRDKEVMRVGRIRARVKAFAMPGVTPGAIVEYRWKEIRFDPNSLYFRAQMQREFPVQKVTYFLKPLSRDYTPYQMVTWPFNCKPSNLTLGNDGFHSMSVENIPAFREEPMMPGQANVRPWVLIFYSDGKQKEPEKYWGDRGKEIYRTLKISLKVNNEIKAAAAEAVAGAQSDEDKVLALIRYIRKNVRNVYDSSVSAAERDKFYKDLPKSRFRTSEEIFKGRIGTANEMNTLFAAMASTVGLEARQALLGNRSDIAFHPTLVDDYFLPYIDMAVNVGGQWKVYDVSARLMPASMLTWSEEGTPALISDSKKPEFVTTPLSDPENSGVQRIGRFELKEDGALEGTVGLAYTGHMAYSERDSYEGEAPEKQQEMLKDEIKELYPDAEVSDIAIENVEDGEQPLRVRYKVRIPGYAQRTGKRLLFQPLVFQKGESPMFSATDRKYAIDMRYAWSEADNITIKMPEGFTLERPENPGGINLGEPGVYDLQMAADGQGQVVVSRKLVFGNKGLIIYPLEAYTALKRAFDEIHKRDGTTLIVREAGTGAGTQ